MEHGVTVDILCIVKLQEYRSEFFNGEKNKNSSGKSKTCLLFIKTITIVPISSDAIL